MHGARAQQAAPLREGTAHVGAPLAAPTLTSCEQIPSGSDDSARRHRFDGLQRLISHVA